MMDEVTNSQDVIDSRDVIERVEELEEIVEDPDGYSQDEVDEAEEELKKLKALIAEAEDSPDWHYGETLIRESYFVEYARELVADVFGLGDVPDFVEIDWTKTAENMKVDYIEADFDGVTYLIRA